MKSVLICDDSLREADATKYIIKDFLKQINGNKDVEINVCNDAEIMIRDVREGKIYPDVLFLDVDLEANNYNGIDIAKKINTLAPLCHIVYLTNYLEYAPDIFLTEHLYFVLKSQLRERLPEIYEKMRAKDERQHKAIRIELKKNHYVTIRQAEIRYFERKGRVTYIYGRNEVWKTYQSIGDLEEKLDLNEMARCHNSYIVALQYIKNYTRELCIMNNGEEIPVSRRYQQKFKKAFLDWCGGQLQ